MRIILSEGGILVQGLALSLPGSADVPLALDLISAMASLVENQGHPNPEIVIRLGEMPVAIAEVLT